jgi:amidase
MARSVGDLQLLFNVLAGIGDPVSSSKQIVNAPVNRRTALRGAQVGFYTDDQVSPVTAETRQAVETAAQALTDAGLITEEVCPPGIESGHDLWLKLFSRASVVQLRNVYDGQEEKGGDFVRWRLATADDTPPPSLDDYINSWLERDNLRATLIDWMEDTPLLIAPVGATPAYEHDTHKVTVGERTMSTFRAFSYCQTFNTFDLPVVVVPLSVSKEGLPIGVQIIGRPFAEETVLAAAAIIEESVGGWQPPPAFAE